MTVKVAARAAALNSITPIHIQSTRHLASRRIFGFIIIAPYSDDNSIWKRHPKAMWNLLQMNKSIIAAKICFYTGFLK